MTTALVIPTAAIPPEPWWLRYRVNLPEQRRADWRIFHQVCDRYLPADAVNAKDWGRPLPAIWPGTYTILQRRESVRHTYRTDHTDGPADDGRRMVMRDDWVTWMSDAPGEIHDQVGAIERLTGRVLIGGLGLGVMVKAALECPDVTRVDVLEIDPDIMAMVGPHYRDPRLNIIHTNALQWRPSKAQTWDVVWMDIWAHVTAKNLPDMILLANRYRDRCGWYGAWCQEWCVKKLRNQAGDLAPDVVEIIERELESNG